MISDTAKPDRSERLAAWIVRTGWPAHAGFAVVTVGIAVGVSVAGWYLAHWLPLTWWTITTAIMFLLSTFGRAVAMEFRKIKKERR